MRDVRERVDAAAAKRGHPVRLGVRVPSRPEVALGLGLDAVAWAKEELIQLLVVTPRWATIEFDMPMQQWREKLEGAKVTLAGGLEVLYQPYPGGPMTTVSPELASGAAASVLLGGADAVYLFNFFQDSHPGWSLPVYQATLQNMASLDLLLKQPRCIGVTHRDITLPAEKYQAPLPATGTRSCVPDKVRSHSQHWLELRSVAWSGFLARRHATNSLCGWSCLVHFPRIVRY